MPISIIIFGQLTDITGNSLSLDDVPDTDTLVKRLNKLYPEFTNKKYVIAVDKQVITANTILSKNNTVALLPPFSGG